MSATTFRSVHYLFLPVLLLWSFTLVRAQDVDYARHWVNTLSSKSMHGRGYVKKGDHKAAVALARQLKKDGLTPLAPGYMQAYTIPISTLPGKVKVTLGDMQLIPAIDYYVSANAPSIKGQFQLTRVPDTITTTDQLEEWLHMSSVHGGLVLSEPSAKLYGTDLPGIKVAVLEMNDKLGYWHVSRASSESKTAWVKLRPGLLNEDNMWMELDVESRHFQDYPTQNVVAMIEGTQQPDSLVVFTAHYDHLGMMGDKVWFPGANDNASGTAMVMDLARHFADHPPSCSVAFLLFSGEESGLHGSTYFADHPLIALDKIRLLVNLDMVGSGSEGITVVNGQQYPELMDQLRAMNHVSDSLPQIKARGESCNSDHCPFYQKGVRSVFIYTMGKECPYYHTVTDAAGDHFPFTAYHPLFTLLTELADPSDE